MGWEDSDTVRQTFRHLCQHATLLTGVVSAVYAIVLYSVDVRDWYAACVPVPFCPLLHWMQSTRRPYSVFMGGLIVMLGLVVGMCIYATLKYGQIAGFHLILMTVFPMLAISGRLSMSVKWLLAGLVTLFVIALDAIAFETAGMDALPSAAVTVMRAMNLAIPALCTTGLALRYFHLAAQQHIELTKLAMIDPLTGLYNRRQMTERAQKVIGESRRDGEPLSLILCDLDHFKAINDRYGHEAGDSVLRQVGRELGRNARAEDSVGRWGGEEFLLLLPQTDLEGAGVLARRLRARIAELIQDRDVHAPRVTATLGVAMFRHDDTLEKVISRADAALYAGKASGRDQVMAEAA